LNIPVIDTNTNEVQALNVSDIFYITRKDTDGKSVIKVKTENNEYQMLSSKELIKYLSEDGEFVRSDRGTYINPSKVKRLDSTQMSVEFENGKQTIVSRLGFKAIDVLLNKSK